VLRIYAKGVHYTRLKMIKIINNQSDFAKATPDKLSIINRRGAALLVVLFVVMAITILSLGFLTRSDVELVCGQNMVLRTQMDYLAESGLQHAKGLILNPQDIEQEYWMGATAQQLASGSDYYDVVVSQDLTDHCNYIIDCNAYRLKDGEEVGRSGLTAELRLDPCIALCLGTNNTLWSTVTVNGDVNCVGTLTNQGRIYGDVFATSLIGTGIKTGQLNPQILSLTWPNVNVEDFKDKPGVTYFSDDPNGAVNINGMLIVDANLTVRGPNNVIIASKNLPALYVTDDLIIEKDASLKIEGLAVIDGSVSLKENASLNIIGGLFIRGTLSGPNTSVIITAEPSKTAIITWSEEGTPQKWGQAAGAFFKSIQRK